MNFQKCDQSHKNLKSGQFISSQPFFNQCSRGFLIFHVRKNEQFFKETVLFTKKNVLVINYHGLQARFEGTCFVSTRFVRTAKNSFRA